MTEGPENRSGGASMPPAEPQSVATPLTSAAIFLTFTIDAGGEDTVRALLPDVAGLRRAVAFRRPETAPEVVIGIGADAWPRLFAADPPPELHPFVELDGGRHRAPSTPGDLLFHIQAESPGACFALADQIMGGLRGAVSPVDEVHGFQYFDRRNLLGFVDGTENPEGVEAADAAYIDADDPFAAGSYAIVQKYHHDMDGWNAVSVEEQQRVVGRTKLDDIELGDDQPANSHVALTDIADDDGNDLSIYRANMPFGAPTEDLHGTYFIGYAKRADTLERMLRNMFLGDPPGNYDRLLDFSTPQTGNLYFVPSQSFLGDLPAAPVAGGAAAEDTGDAPAPDTDGSLGIGSLK
ncbi:Dyp-type peroxidase [Tomitella cavernea]|uniref:Dyp-type peroxidase n=2 Tax=Tomitella cavernea TaxID=1387982 RepID=A0ABP9CHW8_9ACTN